MNLSIIIHALIIIFILHIILINIDFSITLGTPISKSIEKMTNQREFSIVEKDKENESLDFLLGKNNKKTNVALPCIFIQSTLFGYVIYLLYAILIYLSTNS